MEIKYFDDKLSFLEYLFDSSQNKIKTMLSDYLLHENYMQSIHNKLSILENQGIQPNRLSNEKGEIIYSCIRHFKPSIVVETGVATGFSSSCALMGLMDNNFGRLISVDYPNYKSSFKKIARDFKYNGIVETLSYSGIRHILGYFIKKNYHIPKGEKSGWVIPAELKKYWRLYNGLSKNILPNVISKTNSVDVFFHDSDHSEENMLFEFRFIWPFISDNNIILSDDVNINNAFNIFCNEIKYKKALIYKGQFGAIVK
tara:strand:+ start:386 stop:1156 length:771 start_codon:yes stop_codon:yes gene_type:complete